MKTQSSWTYRFQLVILISLVANILIPYVNAQVSPPTIPDQVPTNLPTTVPTGILDNQTAGAQAALDRQVREQTRETQQAANNALRERLDAANVPSNPVNALGGDSAQAASDVAHSDGLQSVDSSLASSGLPPTDASALIQGDASGLVDAGITNPTAINHAVSQAGRAYSDARNESLFATAQSNWASGVKSLANCSSGDDDGKDFCQSLEDLKTVLNEIKSDMRDIVNKSHRLQAYVTAKPAYLNTPSLSHPVCNGLMVPGPNVPLSTVNIADTDQAYDPASGRLTLEAVKNELLAAGNLAETQASLDTSLTGSANATNILRTTDGLYRSNVTSLQGSYDRLSKRIWQNFDTTMEARFQTLKKHTEEMDTLARQLVQIESLLAQRPRTP